MQHDRNAGKKLLVIRIVRQSFDLINLCTGENPLVVFIRARARTRLESASAEPSIARLAMCRRCGESISRCR
jgi:ribosomal protein S7